MNRKTARQAGRQIDRQADSDRRTNRQIAFITSLGLVMYSLPGNSVLSTPFWFLDPRSG